MDSDGSWPTKLPIAVFAANTKIKRSTKFSAFELMFGRKCNPVHLIKLCNNASMQDDSGEYEESLSDEEALTEYHDEFSGPLDAIAEDLNDLQNIRTQNQIEARMNIKIEQTTQKRIFVKKVKDNR